MPHKSYEKALESGRKSARRFKEKNGVCVATAWRQKYPEKDKAARERERVRRFAKREQYNAAGKAKREEMRRFLLGVYGGKCACCGESESQFLTFDHINNDGGKHRRALGSLRAFYKWLQEDYRDDIQVLCFNCNCSKGFYGACPHTREASPCR